MTFKHDNLSSSPIFRQLERIAVEKGLIKEDKIEKQASLKSNLIASTNLIENLIKLSSGLRNKGLNSHADEIENALIKYKRAKSEIDSSLLQKGSKKVSNMSGDCTVEDILDKHIAMMKSVEKLPTGKFAKNQNILRDVKKALGQIIDNTIESSNVEAQDNDNRIMAAANALAPISDYMAKLLQYVNNEMTASFRIWAMKKNIAEVLADIKTLPVTAQSLDDLHTDLGDLADILNKEIVSIGIRIDESEPMQKLVQDSLNCYMRANDFLTGNNDAGVAAFLKKQELENKKMYEKEERTKTNLDKQKQEQKEEQKTHIGEESSSQFISFNQTFIQKYSRYSAFLLQEKSKVTVNTQWYQNVIDTINYILSEVSKLNTKLQSSPTFHPGDISDITSNTMFEAAHSFVALQSFLSVKGSEIEKAFAKAKTLISKG